MFSLRLISICTRRFHGVIKLWKIVGRSKYRLGACDIARRVSRAILRSEPWHDRALSRRNREVVLAPVIEHAIVRLIQRVQRRSARRDPMNVIARRSWQLDRVATRLRKIRKRSASERENHDFTINSESLLSGCLWRKRGSWVMDRKAEIHGSR